MNSKLLFCLTLTALFSGCQSPATFYANGVLFWYSPSAVGIGYGEYLEVAPGGKLERTIKGENEKGPLKLKVDNTGVKEESDNTGVKGESDNAA